MRLEHIPKYGYVIVGQGITIRIPKAAVKTHEMQSIASTLAAIERNPSGGILAMLKAWGRARDGRGEEPGRSSVDLHEAAGDRDTRSATWQESSEVRKKKRAG